MHGDKYFSKSLYMTSIILKPKPSKTLQKNKIANQYPSKTLMKNA